jgi:hypothetical protein
VALVWAGLLLVHQVFEPRPGVVAVAVLAVFLLVATFAYAWVYGPRLAAWVGLAAAFVASRSVMALATGRIFAVRDALDHIYGLPLDIVRTGQLSDDHTYSAYPALQVLLAEVHLVTGLPLWEGAALLAVLLGLATMGLVARTTEALWPGSALAGAAGLLVAFLAIPPAQLYQPMTLSILLFAFLVFLVVNGDRVAWAPGLFVLGIIALGLTHPYSAAIIGLVMLVALAIQAFLGRSVRFLVPMSAFMGLGVLYVAYIGGDLLRFLDLLRPNDVAPIPLPDTGTGGGDASAGPGFSDAYRQAGSWAFRLSMAAALAGWVWAFWPRPLRAVFLQVVTGVAGAAYLAARVVSYGFPVRVLTIASVVTAPLIGLVLHRSPRLAVIPLVAVLAALAIASPSATYQFFPGSKGDPTVHAFDDPPETADLVHVFSEIQGGELRHSNPVSSHPVFRLDDVLDVRAFANTDRAGTALHTHFIFREDAVDFGFAVATTQSGTPARRDAYVPYPTQAMLDHLASLDRFGDFGTYGLHRG